MWMQSGTNFLGIAFHPWIVNCYFENRPCSIKPNSLYKELEDQIWLAMRLFHINFPTHLNFSREKRLSLSLWWKLIVALSVIMDARAVVVFEVDTTVTVSQSEKHPFILKRLKYGSGQKENKMVRLLLEHQLRQDTHRFGRGERWHDLLAIWPGFGSACATGSHRFCAGRWRSWWRFYRPRRSALECGRPLWWSDLVPTARYVSIRSIRVGSDLPKTRRHDGTSPQSEECVLFS